MKLKNIRIIYLKELLDTIRDRRTLIAMIVVPLLLSPVMIIGIGWFSTSETKKMAEEPARIVVIGKGNAPKLYELISKSPQIEVKEKSNPKQALANKEIQAILEISNGFESKVEQSEQATLSLIFDAAVMKSGVARGKLVGLLENYKKDVINQRFEIRKIEQSILTPFTINEQNVASEEKMAGMILGLLLPYMVIILALTGAMYPAIDLTAGEKERGTMETLLVSPATRFELVTGKFLTVFTASMITAILATTSMFVTFSIGMSLLNEIAKGLTFSIQFGAVFTMLLLMVPVTMIFSAVLISIAIFARSYKEAQSYISPLMILVILPVIIPMISPGMEINARLAFVPIMNVSLILKDVFLGSYKWGYISLIFLSTALYAAIALFIATRLFKKEKVLFKT
jgi:sodium transport system permease protein